VGVVTGRQPHVDDHRVELLLEDVLDGRGEIFRQHQLDAPVVEHGSGEVRQLRSGAVFDPKGSGSTRRHIGVFSCKIGWKMLGQGFDRERSDRGESDRRGQMASGSFIVTLVRKGCR
jgi:hypothetical protein